MILSHHGALEFGSPVQPMTAEAEIVHWADEASAKANDMIESLEDSEAFPSGSAFIRQAALARGSPNLASTRRHVAGLTTSAAARWRDVGQGQGGLSEYGVPKTAARLSDGSSVRMTTSNASPSRSTLVKSR